MSGPADLPEGFEPDAPPQAGEGEDLTLEGILREAGVDPNEVWPQPAPRVQTLHEKMANALRPMAQPTGRTTIEFDDPPQKIATWASALAGRVVGYEPTWVRFIRPDLGRGALFVLHTLNSGQLTQSPSTEPTSL